MKTRDFLFAAALGAMVLASTAPANAGLFDIFKRDQQVAPPTAVAPTPPAGVGDAGSTGATGYTSDAPSPSSEAQAAMRMDRMEQQMRQMTGQIEELTFQLGQLQAQIRSMQPGSGRKTASAAPAQQLRPSVNPATSADPIARAIGSSAPAAPAAGGTDPAAAVAAAPGVQPRSLGQLPSTAAGQPLDLATLATPPPAAAETPAPSGDSRSDYDAAYDLVLKGDYDVAENAFQLFLANYPGDPLAADAQFWIGESLYQRSNYRGAADAFLTGYQLYPKSGKAPDMLLKLGLSLVGLGQREAACGTYAEILKKYPKASNALMQRVKTEQTSASC